MLIIGLTGTIGSGKSTVAQYLEKEGFVWIDADKAGHEFLEEDSPVYKDIMNLFGTNARESIREQVFIDPEKLESLNNLLHPLINQTIKQCLNCFDIAAPNKIVIDAALLFEIGLDKYCEEIWAVWSNKRLIKSRMKAKNWSPALVNKVLKVQKDLDFLIDNADIILENNGDRVDLLEQVMYQVNRINNE
ncbi:dephospho-CoA kinase [Candidatus Margulisiibacteriota bacterium]